MNSLRGEILVVLKRDPVTKSTNFAVSLCLRYSLRRDLFYDEGKTRRAFICTGGQLRLKTPFTKGWKTLERTYLSQGDRDMPISSTYADNLAVLE